MEISSTAQHSTDVLEEAPGSVMEIALRGRTGCNPNVLSSLLAMHFTLQDAIPVSIKRDGSGVPTLLHGDL